MSKRRAIAGAALLPLSTLAKLALMLFTFLWVLVADILPADCESILEEWRRENDSQ